MAGEGLKAIREKAGMTQRQLGEHLNVHYTSIYGWENGRTRPSRNHVLKLEEVLGLDGELLREYAYAGVTPFDELRAEVEQLAEQGIRLTELVMQLQAELERQGEEIDGLRKR
jgi:transcriptional regulator with XRE-family HTH domain